MNLRTCLLPLLLCVLSPLSGKDCWDNINPERFNRKDFSRTLLHETFDGLKEPPCTVEYLDGATGKVELLPGAGRNGGTALRTVKTGNTGHMIIRFNRKVSVKAGDKVQCNIFYRTKQTIPHYSLGLLRLQAPGQKDFRSFSFYSGIDGGRRLQEILGTAPETWERKFTQRKAGEEDSFFVPTLVLTGAASEAVWDDLYVEDDNITAEFWDKTLNRKTPRDRSAEMLSDEVIDRRLAKEPDHTGKVVSIGGRSRLLIDGKPALPVINGPYSRLVKGKTYSNAGEFAAAGIHLVKVSLRLGQGHPASTYPGLWTGKGQFDLAQAVSTFRAALRLDADARIILSFLLHPYADFCKDHPEETWLDGRGRKVYGSGIHISETIGEKLPNSRRYHWPSYQSEILRNCYKEQIRQVIAELKRTGLSKVVVGIHIGGGHDNQLTLTQMDYSAPAIRNFRKYLKRKYGTVQALQKAWNQPAVTFENAAAPKFDHSRDCLDPKTEQNRIDFFEYSKCAPWQMASDLADYCRQELGKQVFTMRWCMSPYSGNPGSSLDIDNFLHRQHFDILVAQAAYNMRPPGSPCLPRLPLDSFHLNRKIYVNEFDLRTWNAAPSWEKEIMSIGWGLVLDPPMWRASHRKLAGSMFANGMGYWYLDMAPGWYDHPEIMEDIRSTAEAGRKMLQSAPSAWKKDSAIVVDNEGLFHYNLPSPQWKFDMSYLLPEQVNLLGLSGVPFAYLSLQDLLKNPALARQFKVLVFAGMLNIDGKRMKLLSSLKNSGRTLVFLSGTGRLGGAEEGSGFPVKTTGRVLNHDVIAEPGVTDNMNSDWMTNWRTVLNRAPQWFEYITIAYAEARPGDKVLARFAFNGKPAVIERRHRNWKAVYIGEAGGLTPDYFNQLVREAGAYYVTASGNQCETDGSFLSIHCMTSGDQTFRFPFQADVVNLRSGKIHRNIRELKTRAAAGSTYWFRLEARPFR